MGAIKESKKEIANLQAIQLSKGQTSKGGELPTYSKTSQEVFGKPNGPWTLRDTGDFYRGLDLKNIDKTGWTLFSTDSKQEIVLGMVAGRLFGNRDKVKEAAAYVFGLNNETRKGGATNPALAKEILFPKIKKIAGLQSALKL